MIGGVLILTQQSSIVPFFPVIIFSTRNWCLCILTRQTVIWDFISTVGQTTVPFFWGVVIFSGGLKNIAGQMTVPFFSKNWHNSLTVLYTKLYITPKTISRRNQKTNTTPQLYCTLSTWVCTTKPISHQNQKLTRHNSTTGKKVPPAHAKRVYSNRRPDDCTFFFRS